MDENIMNGIGFEREIKPRLRAFESVMFGRRGWICIGPHPKCGTVNGRGDTPLAAYHDYLWIVRSYG
jgi:hypothetical protein